MNWLQLHYNKKPPTAGKNKNTVASSDPKSHSPQENIWFGFRQTQQKIRSASGNLEKSRILEHFYRNARTYFSKNQQIRTDVKWKKEDNLRNQPRRLPAKGWPAPPALTFAFFGFPHAVIYWIWKRVFLVVRLLQAVEAARLQSAQPTHCVLLSCKLYG